MSSLREVQKYEEVEELSVASESSESKMRPVRVSERGTRIEKKAPILLEIMSCSVEDALPQREEGGMREQLRGLELKRTY